MSEFNLYYLFINKFRDEFRSRPEPKTRLTRRRMLLVESLEERTLLASISESGGVGGVSRTLSLTTDLNIISFRWENFSIPDEFQISQAGRRIAGDVGLQSNGSTGTTVIARNQGSDQLQLKVTAPRQGTAWNFDASLTPMELRVTARLGDVTGFSIDELITQVSGGKNLVSLGIEMNSLSFVSTSNDKGTIAEVDGWQNLLKERGIFYFVPKVTGEPLNYSVTTRSDPGLGESELVVRATINTESGQRQIEFPVKINVTSGFSTMLVDPGQTQPVPAVNASGKTKLDIYRQEQRLAYLGYVDKSGSPLTVDGIANGDETKWASSVFSIALDNRATGRGQLPNPTSGIKYFKDYINADNPPHWRDLRGNADLAFPPAQNTSNRFFASDIAVRMIDSASLFLQPTIGRALTSNGAAQKSGNGSPSRTHDGGRGLDLLPWFTSGRYYFAETGQFVSANQTAGGGFVYRNQDGNWVGGGSVNNPQHVERALGTQEFVTQQTPGLASDVRELLNYRQEEFEIGPLLDAFIAAGSPLIFYNDPRFFTADGPIKYSTGAGFNHANHVHITVPGIDSFNAQGLNALQFVGDGQLLSLGDAESSSLSMAIDLGRIDGQRRVLDSLDAIGNQVLYRLEVGSAIEYSAVFPNQPRDLEVVLSGLNAAANLDLIAEFSGDGVGEIIASTNDTDLSDRQIKLNDLPAGVYYLRVIGANVATNFDLSVTVSELTIFPDEAGNSLASGAVLGNLLDRTIGLRDFVGEVDADDFYRFTISDVANLRVAISELGQGDVLFSIGSVFPGTNQVDAFLATAYREGEDPGVIDIEFLPKGEYFVHVASVSGNTNYHLELIASTTTPPLDSAGDTSQTARDLGSIDSQVQVSDFVGTIDPVDLYKFTVSSLVGVRIELSGLTSDADIELYRDVDGDGQLTRDERLASSVLSGTEDDVITMMGLLPGTYFVRVAEYEADTEYNLTVAPLSASGANLVLTRSDSTADVDLGDQFTYSVTVSNNGPDAATNVRLTETLPSGFQRIRVTRSGATSSVQNTSTGFVGVIPRLEPGQSATFDVTVRTFVAGRLLMRSVVTSDTPDIDLTTNRLNDLKTVNSITSPPADLELSKSVDNLTPSVGDRVAIVLSLTNRGPGTATDIKVQSNLPDGLEFVSGNPGPGAFFDQATGIWDVGNMPVNATVRLTIVAEVLSNQPLKVVSEVIEVAEADPDSTPGNNDPTEDDYAEITINARPTGITLVGEALKVGRNRLEIQNATPGGVVVLVHGSGAGQSAMDKFGVTLEVADGIIVAQAVVQPDGRAHLLFNIKDSSELNSIRLQAFEQAPEPRVTNVLSGPVVTGGLTLVEFIAEDLNGDGVVSPLDALTVLNHLSPRGAEGEGLSDDQQRLRERLDVNKDGLVSPLDALFVLNYLSRRSAVGGEGEAFLSKTNSMPNSDEKLSDEVDDDLLVLLAADASRTWFDSELSKKRRITN